MLEPQTRAALTEQLAPPPGYTLSHAVGTTFTLDLATALTVPLSFASRRISRDDGSLGVLDAVRRAADRVDIFAQAGEIGMGRPSDLVAFLEQSIHPVVARQGLFHPKVWFLEYRHLDDSEDLTYRYLCASRNLTNDRSWDVIARFDGAPAATGRRRDAASRIAPLVGLLRALPGLATRPLPPDRVTRLDALADRWRSVDLETPREMRDLTFHVFGLDKRPTLDLRGPRALVISPFVTDGGLRLLRDAVHGPTHLVSRPDSLDQLAPSSLDGSLVTYVLDDAATFPDDTADTVDPGVVAPVAPDAPPRARLSVDRVLSGLHAKVVVVDRHDGAHVLLGSANATEAALQSNVEVMVELTAPAPRFGVGATLEALGALVEPFATDGGASPDPEAEAEHALEIYLRRFAGSRLTMRLHDSDPFEIEVWNESTHETGGDHDLRWHLLSRPDIGGTGLPGPPDAPTRATVDELADVTPFVVLVARDLHGRERRTIVVATLLDDIERRHDAVIARQLTDTAAFIRLLTLLLELSGVALPVADPETPSAGGVFGHVDATSGAGLFEALVRAVGAGHSGLEDVRRLVDYLATLDGQDVLPPGFDALWSSVWAAHEQIASQTGGNR
ncbi:hypothetical protein C8046_11785 [Serinibacter arcticus]|uniref:PLD phosphodiesterase domain-containing protein n=1 Tax=Serinibacter arcticus TaxID=1655435 RepID=A0A2U1ZWB9_9MICO|nr:phospholipase D family protein [Serinibacter arcticus]PWD51233.1 hypothetical protein C8046_11785 [Serinibacter arcticus]